MNHSVKRVSVAEAAQGQTAVTNFRQGCHLCWRCSDVGHAFVISEKGPTRQLAAGRFRRKKTKQKLHYYNVHLCNTCRFWSVLQIPPSASDVRHLKFSGPCALTGPPCWVCQCCIIRCMMRCMNDDNSWFNSPLSLPNSFRLIKDTGVHGYFILQLLLNQWNLAAFYFEGWKTWKESYV